MLQLPCLKCNKAPASRKEHQKRGKFFVWCNVESKKFYWQRIEIESGIQAPLTRKAKKLIGIQYRGIRIHRLKYRIQGYLGLPYKYMVQFL